MPPRALKAMQGTVVLWDAHSTRSVLPRIFEGRLTDLKLGTGGTSCDPALAAELLRIASSASGHTAVSNGRIKGGQITRTYENPEVGVHALEMTQVSYVEEQLPFAYLPETAMRVQAVIKKLRIAEVRFPMTTYNELLASLRC